MLRLRQQLLVIDLDAAVGLLGGGHRRIKCKWGIGFLEVRCRKLT